MHILIIIGTGITKITTLNDMLRSLFQKLYSVAWLALGTALLIVQVQMACFGWLHRSIDMRELSSQPTRYDQDKSIDAFVPWKDFFGYRLTARKIIADHEFRDQNLNFDIGVAEAKIKDVLAISPSEPAYWVTLARLKQLQFAPIEEIVKCLRLSYLSGRGVYQLMASRLQIALSVWSALDPTDQIAVVNDLIYGPTRFEDNIPFLFASLDPPSLTRLLALVEQKDAQLSIDLAKVIESQRR